MLLRFLNIGVSICKHRKGFISVLLLCSSLFVYAQQYDFREYSDGLAQPYVYSIIQDNDGYLWIGTGNGLSRYNGFDFKTYTTNDSLADNFITCSFKKENDLWFGHMNGEVSHFNGKVFEHNTFPGNHTGITDIESRPDGVVYAASYADGIFNFNALENDLRVELKNQIVIFSFKFITDKELLLGSVNGLSLCRLLETGKIEVIRHFSEIPASKIPDIIEINDGSGYYVATENEGIFKITTENSGFIITNITAELKTDLNGVQSMLEDSSSNLWVSTFGNGLVKLNHNPSGQFASATCFNRATGFSTDNLKTTFEDREGNIWTGNYGTGLTQITRQAFSFYSLGSISYGTAIYSLFSDNKFIWIGTDKGLYKINRTDENILALYSYGDGLPKDKITSIYSEEGRELWIGTENHGIYRMKVVTGRIVPYSISSGILENSINTITGRNNQVWIGTKKGICNLNTSSGKIDWYTIENGGLPHNYINHLFIDSKGRLWVSALGNILSFIEDGKVGKVTINSEKGLISLGSISEDHDSTIWVGSYGGGIFRIESDSIANITSKEGLFSDYCFSLMADDNDNVWIGHQGGLSKLRTTDLLVKSLHQYIGENNNYEFSKNAILKDDKERIWFGSDQGLWIYDPSLQSQVGLPPVLNITSFRVNDAEINHESLVKLRPGNYKIEFEFLGISLTEPANVNYKYQLVGYDQAPENTKGRSIIYPNLKNGRYTFLLWSSTGDGVITREPLTINILIRTSVLDQWWFYIIIMVTLVAAAVIYDKGRRYKHQKEMQVLESKVEERTHELEQKNSELKEKQEMITVQNTELQKYHNYLEELVDERTKELLKAKNKAEESDRLKTAFLQNLSHEVRTPMNGIIGFLGLLKSSDISYNDRDNFIDIINQSSQRLISTITDIVEISKIESNQITVKSSPVNIVELMDSTLCMFEPIAKQKGLIIRHSVQASIENAFIVTDKDILNIIIQNLINNAIKFTPDGMVSFGCIVKGESMIFNVKDTGIGIPANRLEAIFDRFVQAEVSLNRTYEGSGLGLSLVKEYLELLNGKIWIESEVGKGSTFYFSLPLRPQ